MANDNEIAARGGLLPVQFPFGNYRRTLYRLVTSAAANIFIGQPMTLDAAGGAAITLVGTASNSAILGPVVGWVDVNKAGLPSAVTDLDQGGYLPANTDAYVMIADDPDQLFCIQEGTAGTALTQAAIGSRLGLTYDTASGSTITGYSTCHADPATTGTTTGASIQLVGLVDKMNSDGTSNAFGDYAKLLVRIANHSLSQDKHTVV